MSWTYIVTLNHAGAGSLGTDMDDLLGGYCRSWCSAPARVGWQRHHLIPRQVWRYPDLRVFLSGLHVFGIDLENFAGNGMFLPAEPAVAEHYRLPLHVGGHRVYNDVMVSLVAYACDLNARGTGPFSTSVAAVRALQRLTREVLQQCAVTQPVDMSGRDPFGTPATLEHLLAEAKLLLDRALAMLAPQPVDRALQDIGGGELVDQVGAARAAGVGIDQRTRDRGRRPALVPQQHRQAKRI